MSGPHCRGIIQCTVYCGLVGRLVKEQPGARHVFSHASNKLRVWRLLFGEFDMPAIWF
jgi:hypothetical protein